MENAINKSNSAKNELNESVDDYINQSLVPIEDQKIADLEQNDQQIELSKQIAYNDRIVADVTRKQKTQTGWIYAGAQNNQSKSWITKYFSFGDNGPEVNYQYIADRALNIREEAPSIKNGVWQKGSIISGLAKDDSFIVTETIIVPGTNDRSLWWVRIIMK